MYGLQLHSPELRGTLPAAPVLQAAPTIVAADLHAAWWHGTVALLLALVLALSSVFREQLPRALRLGAWLENENALRKLQSGHSGDYVLYLTTGVAIFGWAEVFFLR